MIASDAGLDQVNGVATTLRQTIDVLESDGHVVQFVSPKDFPNFAFPLYPDVRLPLSTLRLGKMIESFAPDALHIAVEGPLGLTARNYCVGRNIPFTTAYHTDFPSYLATMAHIPKKLSWRYLRWFHRASSSVLVSTQSIADELHEQNIMHTTEWTRGVDLTQFYPVSRLPNPRPIFLYVGRISREKNIEAFLSTKLPFECEYHIVGDGPLLNELKARFPEAMFHGKASGKALADHYRCADVFVFPSRSDTFGLVMIEAMACGVPVAAYPVKGPVDVVGRGGVLDNNLGRAMEDALSLPTQEALRQASQFTWRRATDQFIAALTPITNIAD